MAIHNVPIQLIDLWVFGFPNHDSISSLPQSLGLVLPKLVRRLVNGTQLGVNGLDVHSLGLLQPS